MSKAIRSRVFPCNINASNKHVWRMINRSARRRGGDWAEPQSFRCFACGTRWDAGEFSGGHDPLKITCSNCYSERVEIVALKVERVNWEQVMRESREVRS